MYKTLLGAFLFTTLLWFHKPIARFFFGSNEIEIVERKELPTDKVLDIDTTLIANYNSQDLKNLYISFSNKTIWESSKNRKEILDELSKANEEGLLPSDYQTNVLIDFESNFEDLSDEQLVNYDLQLSYNLQKYVLHICNGKLNSKNVYKNWDLKPKETNINKAIISGYKSEDFTRVLDSCKPQHLVYKELKKALQIINSLPDDTISCIEVKDRIKPGEKNKMVKTIKRKLMFWQDLEPLDTLTKIYDKKTVEAVKRFQERHGLTADGVIGKGTVFAMNYTKTQRQRQIIANLERWRWFPHIFDEKYLIINIPDYNLRYVEGKDTIKTHKVVVGRNARRTPILTSKLDYIVLNPTWTVPPTIIREDLVPDATKDRNYFRKSRIKIFNTKGKEVSAWQWNPEKADKYKYVQEPGDKNSLGNVKLNFPNRFAVYLHDTNHRDYFAFNYRSLSSGCVRIHNPLDLTKQILNDTINYSQEKIDEIIKTRQTKNIPLKQDIHVYQWYWTAWSEKNKLIFREDIYFLDDDLYDLLRK